MRLVVPVKQVATLDDDFELSVGETTVDPDYLELDLNEWDSFSLEAALQLKETAGDDCEVIALTVGDEHADEALLACLAKGADRAVRIWDERLEGADPLLVAAVLAPAVEREQPDLVLCGVQSSDSASSATGTALAGLLGLQHVAVVRKLGVDFDGGRISVERELESGLIETLDLAAPALLTIQSGINEPRYATLRAIKQASAKPLETLAIEDLGIDGELGQMSGSRTVTLERPVAAKDWATMIEGDADAVATRILEIVGDALGKVGGGE